MAWCTATRTASCCWPPISAQPTAATARGSRVVGQGALSPSRERLEAAFDYIRRSPQIRDVLVSGGDPLTLSDEKLEWILSNLRAIPHIEIIRLGTKVPAVLPQRVTPQLARMLRKYHPVWMSLHFTHPDECCYETGTGLRHAGPTAGIPLGSQTVLLKGVNDNVATMKSLMHGLMKMRVRPYYIYQCDPITGSGHFRTPVSKGLEIIRGLRGHTSGYAVPTYVIDAPGGGGKIPITPDFVTGRDGQDLILGNYEGKTFRYPRLHRGIARSHSPPSFSSSETESGEDAHTLPEGHHTLVPRREGCASPRIRGQAGEWGMRRKTAAAVIVRPKEIDDVLTNPGIGFMTFQRFNGDALNAGLKWTEGFPIAYQDFKGSLENRNHPDTSIAYFRVYWRYLEPEQGKFSWDLFDNALKTAHNRGQDTDDPDCSVRQFRRSQRRCAGLVPHDAGR